ncbi:MAG TPA: hypothetical protein PLM07_07010 [Candidatus Rifleibacterium sp.]|nr:hypothetical protein [Candidatus Rifleibacterium sp.]HPT45632.1 hypothetical protein [Candidatus Rifleibacterium sp.]
MNYPSMKNILAVFLFACLLQPACFAADLTFESFEAAESAAKKRADEYQKRMEEHIKSVNEDWEKQQKDLGSDASSPDITSITTRSDGQKSSDTDAGKSMENAVNSSVNKLKDEMISKASPNTTGFAGGAAGYQWSVKFKNGKYVLSDSYNEAEFNTGKKKEPAPVAPPAAPVDENTGDDQETAETAKTPAPEPTEPAVAANPDATTQPAATTPAGTDKPAAGEPQKTPGQTTAAATKPATAVKPAEPEKPKTGVDPAPAKLPPPSVRMVIQHPTEFSEEVFAGNTTSESTANYRLDKFKIPEDTRIKISVEVGDDVRPEDVSMVVTDDQGDSAPVSAARLKNYRHMFRVPSDDQYSASVFVTDTKTPGNQQKKILQVMIPVSKVDFESRTIDNQRGSKAGSATNNMSSGDTSSSASSQNNVDHSGFGQPQQVDLSDLYSDPANAASTGQTGQNGAAADSKNPDAANANRTGASAGSGSDNQSINEGSSGSSSTSSSAADGNPGSIDTATDNSEQPAQADQPGQSLAGDTPEASNESVSGENDASSSETSGSSSSSSEETAGSDANLSSTSDSNAGSDAADNNNTEGSALNDASSELAAPADAQNLENGAQSLHNAGAAASGNDPEKLAGNSANSKAPGAGKDGLPAQDEEDPFVLALSLKAEAQKVYQSFDFIDGHAQTSADIKAGGEVAFSLNLGAQVQPESVQIKVSDGSQEIKGNLKRMGESFVYVFPSATPNAYIEISGKTAKQSFSYRLGIPVK